MEPAEFVGLRPVPCAGLPVNSHPMMPVAGLAPAHRIRVPPLSAAEALESHGGRRPCTHRFLSVKGLGMDAPAIVVIGAGPRGTGLLERLAANAEGLLPLDFACTVHVVDEFEAGSGRVWRRGQSPLLWMNSRAADITMFTDSSVGCAGPLRTGPTLHEWARSIAADSGVEASSFAGRRFAGGYLRWCFQRAADALPARVRLEAHEARALSVSQEPDGTQSVRLSTGAVIRADIVVLAVGNQNGVLDEQQRVFASFALGAGGGYLPPGYTADLDLDVLPAGEPVIVSGIGQAFADLMVLVTQGRGGVFEDGRYLPSGREPVLCVGSRRGVPAHPKPSQSPVTAPSDAPCFAKPELLKEMLASDAPEHGVAWWNAVHKELASAYYRELFRAQPGRVRMSWEQFSDAFAESDWGGPGMAELLARAVPDPEDRLNLPAERSPLADRVFASEAMLRDWMDGHLRRSVVRATDARHSGQAAVLDAMARVMGTVQEAAASATVAGTLDRVAVVMLGRVGRLGRLLGSGMPPRRFEQLRALAEAGVIRYLGAGLTVSTEGDGASGRFVARTHSLPGTVSARYLVEARLPQDDVRAEGAELLAGLIRGGAGQVRAGGGTVRLAVDEVSYAVVDQAGRIMPRRYALGAFASSGALGALSKPHTDAPFFRQNDDLARRILAEITEIRRG